MQETTVNAVPPTAEAALGLVDPMGAVTEPGILNYTDIDKTFASRPERGFFITIEVNLIYKHKIKFALPGLFFMTIGCITNKKNDNVKLETSPLENVTAFNFEESFPLRDGSQQIHKHHVVMMEEPISLGTSYEPFDPSRNQWHMMVGLHFSGITPKRADGDDCPHYEEQIVFVAGGEELDSEIFVSSQFMTRHRILSAQHYIFNKKNGNVRHWYALSDPFGDPKIEEKK